MPHATLNGIDIYYERFGDGPTLLYFNGSGTSLETTRVGFDAYAKRFDVVVHDQRGLGATEAPEGPYTMADYAADGVALLDHLGLDRVRVVGISFGGMVAQEFAVTYPDRVERLALLCTSPGGEGRASYPLHELEQLPVEERRARGMSIVDTRLDEAWLASHDVDRMIVDMLVKATPPAPGSDQERGQRGQLEARSHHDVWDRLPVGRVPDPRRRRSLRRHRPARQQRGHRITHPRGRAPRVRGRPRLHLPGRVRAPRDPGLPGGLSPRRPVRPGS